MSDNKSPIDITDTYLISSLMERDFISMYALLNKIRLVTIEKGFGTNSTLELEKDFVYACEGVLDDIDQHNHGVS
tara:strand:+ start:61 stop:285 length:225 start_codon:yes stop_codon:yes gene_type:complete